MMGNLDEDTGQWQSSLSLWEELDETVASKENILKPMAFLTDDLERMDLGLRSSRFENSPGQVYVEHRDYSSGTTGREVPNSCHNPSRSAKCSCCYADPQCEPNTNDNVTDCRSGSDTDDEEEATYEVIESDLVHQQSPENVQMCASVEPIEYKSRGNLCNKHQNSSKVTFTAERKQLKDNDVLWEGVFCSTQESSKQRDSTTALRKQATGSLIQWKNSPLERQLSEKSESSDYVVERVTIVRRRKIHADDDNVSQTEQLRKVDPGSVIRWKGSPSRGPLTRRIGAFPDTGKLHWTGGEMHFNSSYHLIDANPTRFPQRTDYRFNMAASDTKRGLRNRDDEHGAALMMYRTDAGKSYSDEQDCQCRQCRKIAFGEANDFKIIDESLGTEGNNVILQAKQLQSCGQHVRIPKQNYRVEERESSFDCGSQDKQQVFRSYRHEERQYLDQTIPKTYFRKEIQSHQKLFGKSERDATFPVDSSEGRMVRDDSDYVRMTSARNDHVNYNEYSDGRDIKQASRGIRETVGKQQRNSQDWQQESFPRCERCLDRDSSRSRGKSASASSDDSDNDGVVNSKPRRMVKESDQSTRMKPGYHGSPDYDYYNERQHLCQGNRGTAGQQRTVFRRYEEENLQTHEENFQFNSNARRSADNNGVRVKPGYNEFKNWTDSSQNSISKQQENHKSLRSQQHCAEASSLKFPNRSLSCEAMNDSQGWENRKADGMREFSSFDEPERCSYSNATAERYAREQYSDEDEDSFLREISGDEPVRDETQNLEKLLVLFENRASSGQSYAGGQTMLSEQKLREIRCAHEREMHDAKDAAVALLSDFGIKLSDCMISSSMVLQIFRVIYGEWSTARNSTLKILAALEKAVREDENWNAFNTFCGFLKTAGELAVEVLQFTPYGRVATVAARVVPPLVVKAKELLISIMPKAESDSQQHDVLQILQRDIHLSSELVTYARQSETQFEETVQSFVEFRNFVLKEQIADFVEDTGLLIFIIDVYNSDPNSDNFFQQMSEAYRRFQNTREETTSARTVFCGFIDEDPSMLDAMQFMDSRFTQSFQSQITENDLSRCWADINSLVSSITESESPADALKIIRNIIDVLQSQKSDVDNKVSKLL